MFIVWYDVRKNFSFLNFLEEGKLNKMFFFIDFRFLYFWLNNLIDKFFRVLYLLFVIINILIIFLFYVVIIEDDGIWSENNDDVVFMEIMFFNLIFVLGIVLIKVWEFRK